LIIAIIHSTHVLAGQWLSCGGMGTIIWKSWRIKAMFKLITKICMASMLILSMNAYAIPVTWTFQNATFDDGGTIDGSFVYDADSNTLSDWLITTQPGLGPFHLTTKDYTTSNASVFVGPVSPGPSSTAWYAILESDTYFHPINSALAATFRLGTTSVLTNAGGTVGLDLNNTSGECYSCSRARLFNSGTLVSRTLNAPEPPLFSLMIMALALMGIVGRHRS
jgi:hypothetical protein